MNCRYCSLPQARKGLCWGHYRKLRIYGDPLGGPDAIAVSRNRSEKGIVAAAQYPPEYYKGIGRKGGLLSAANRQERLSKERSDA